MVHFSSAEIEIELYELRNKRFTQKRNSLFLGLRKSYA